MTLAEIVISPATAGSTIVRRVSACVFNVVMAERSALSLAANAGATQCLIEMRAARGDPASYPVVDEPTTFPGPLTGRTINQ